MAINTDYSNMYVNTSPFSTGGVSTAEVPFDVGTTKNITKQQAQDIVDSWKSGQGTVKTLKADTAQYLDQYVLSMKTLDKNAEKVRLDNLDKLLYDKEGNITDDTVKSTVSAVQDMVDSYNSTLKLLNNNADRGPGTANQLARMATDPAPKDGMKLVGLTVNSDGTLALDAEKMTEALKTTNEGNLKLYKEIIGGFGGVADGIHKDALDGLNTPANKLVQNDVATMQKEQSATNPFKEMFASIRGAGAFALNNQAVTGMLMNILA